MKFKDNFNINRFLKVGSFTLFGISLSLLTNSAQASEGAGEYGVTLAWNANPEPDISGYRICYGTERGVHPHVIDAGMATSVAISTDRPGVIYVIVIAYKGLNQSPASEELE